jgi:hypothetical protein
MKVQPRLASTGEKRPFPKFGISAAPGRIQTVSSPWLKQEWLKQDMRMLLAIAVTAAGIRVCR